jgi:hypothetical protein
MGLAEELSRLAELKDRGVLTQKEFDRKKKQLLNGGRGGSSKFMMFVASVVLFMIFAGIAVRVYEHLETPGLACDTPEIQEKVVAVVNMQVDEARNRLGVLGPHLIPAGTQIHGLSDARQLYRDEESGFVACVAQTRNEKGEGKVGYTVFWKDSVNGEYALEVANADELAAQYAKAN